MPQTDYTLIQLYRGLKANLPALAEGEPAFATDTGELFVGNSGGNVQIGGLDPNRVRSQIVTLTTSSWIAATQAAYPVPYKYGARYYRSFPVTGITTAYACLAVVIPADNDYSKQAKLVMALTYNGGVRLFAKAVPTGSFTVQLLLFKQTLS